MNQITPDNGDQNRAGGEVRNGWVLCPSKRFSGRYYYFNVLTGDCAWSLNDIDKAKLRKGGQIKRADSFHSYPEPSSPPIDLISPNASGSAFNLNPGNHSQNLYMPTVPTAPTFNTSTPQNYLPPQPLHGNYSTPQPLHSNYSAPQPLHSNYSTPQPLHSNFSTPQQQLMNYQPMYLQPNHHIILATAYPMQNVQNVQNDYYKMNAVNRPMFDQNTQTMNMQQDKPVWVDIQRRGERLRESETPLSRPRNKQIVSNTHFFENTNREVIFDQEQEDYIPFLKQKVVIQNPMAYKNQNNLIQKKTIVSGTKVQCKEIQTESVKILDSNAKLCECIIPKPNRKRANSEGTEERQNYLKHQQLKEGLNKLYFVDTVGNLPQSESTLNSAKVSQRVTETEHHGAERVTEKADKNVLNLAHNDLRLLLLAKRKKSVNLGELTTAREINAEASQESNVKTKKKVTFDFSNLSVESILSDSTDRGTSVDIPEPGPQASEPVDEEEIFTDQHRELAYRRAADVWYIVADLETLTRDFDFVESLVTDDPLCRLYLPLSLKGKLNALTRSFCSARQQVTAARRVVRRLATCEEWVVAESESGSCKEVDIIGCCVNLINNDQHVVLLTDNAVLQSEAKTRQIYCYSKEQASLILTEKQTITFDPKQFKISIINDSYNGKENQNRKPDPKAVITKTNENHDFENRTLPKTNEDQIKRTLTKTNEDQIKRTLTKTNEDQIKRTLPKTNEDQIKRTLTKTNEDQIKRTLTKASEDQIKRTLTKASEDQIKRTLPKSNEDQLKRTLPKANEEQIKRTLPKASEDRIKRTLPKTNEEQIKRTLLKTNEDQIKRTLPKANEDQMKRTLNEDQINRTLFKNFKMAAEKTKEAFRNAKNYVLLAEHDDVTSNDGGDVMSNDGGDVMSNDGGDVMSNDGDDFTSNDGGDVMSNDGVGVMSNDGGDVMSNDGGYVTAAVGSEVATNGWNMSIDRTITSSSYTFDVERELVKFSVLRPATEARYDDRREEWICCYVQIMEDVLTKVIESHASSSQLPPPWTLHEANELIRRGYREHHKIRSVAERLASLLFQFSTDKGVLKSNIKCGDGMRIIGCGVLLIKYLKEHHPEDPDLTSAEVSLSELLHRMEDSTSDPDAQLYDVTLTRRPSDVDDDAGSPVRGSIKRPAEVLPYLRRHFPAWRERADTCPAVVAPSSPQMYTNLKEDVKIVRTCGRNLNQLKIDKANNMSIDNKTKPVNQNASDNDNYLDTRLTLDRNVDNLRKLKIDITNNRSIGNKPTKPSIRNAIDNDNYFDAGWTFDTNVNNLEKLKIDSSNNVSNDKKTKRTNENSSQNGNCFDVGVTSDRNVNKKIVKTVESTVNSVNFSVNTVKSRANAVKSSINAVNFSVNTVRSSGNAGKSSFNAVKSSANAVNFSDYTVRSSDNAVKSSVNAVNSSVDTVKLNVNTVKPNITQKIVRNFCLINDMEAKYNNGFSRGFESQLQPSDDFTNDESLNNDSWKMTLENQAVTQNNTELPTSTGLSGIDNEPHVSSPRALAAHVTSVREDHASDSGLGGECQTAVAVSKGFLYEVKRLFLKIYDFVCAALSCGSVPRALHERARTLRARLRYLQEILRRIVERESGEPKQRLLSLLVTSGYQGDDQRMRRYRQVIQKCSEQAALLLHALDLLQAPSSEHEQPASAPAAFYV